MKLAELIITEARERGLRHFFGLPGGRISAGHDGSRETVGREFCERCPRIVRGNNGGLLRSDEKYSGDWHCQ